MLTQIELDQIKGYLGELEINKDSLDRYNVIDTRDETKEKILQRKKLQEQLDRDLASAVPISIQTLAALGILSESEKSEYVVKIQIIKQAYDAELSKILNLKLDSPTLDGDKK
jgi:hypothetical protein